MPIVNLIQLNIWSIFVTFMSAVINVQETAQTRFISNWITHYYQAAANNGNDTQTPKKGKSLVVLDSVDYKFKQDLESDVARAATGDKLLGRPNNLVPIFIKMKLLPPVDYDDVQNKAAS